jgi:hypothetical protein
VNISRNHFSFSVYHIHVPEKSYEILKMWFYVHCPTKPNNCNKFLLFPK